MTTTADTLVAEPCPEPAPDRDDDRRLRRVLVVLTAVLVAAAAGMLVLLVVLLKPSPHGPKVAGRRIGYPIVVTRSLYGTGKGVDKAFVRPLGVTFDAAGHLWVADTGRSRVVEFSATGTVLRTIGTAKGQGRVVSPYGLAVDPSSGRVYVADWTSRRVFEFSAGGRFLRHLPAPDQDMKVFGHDGFTPYDVHVDGGKVIVSSNDGLYFFDRTGHVVQRFGGDVAGTAVGSFNFPDAFTVDARSGRVYVADTLNRRVVALARDGTVLWVSGVPDAGGKIVGFWQLPRGIAVGADGRIYVVDTFRFSDIGVGVGHVVVLSADGALVSEFGRAGSEDDSFNFPEHLASGPGGQWAVADREHGRILEFRLDGELPPAKSPDPETYTKSFTAPKGVRAVGSLQR